MGTAPRWFVAALALAGEGRRLLEFGQLVDDTDSVKGEIKFPVTERLDPSAPYDRILFGDGNSTTCAGCHGDERPAPDIDASGAYVSRAFQPVDTEFVSVDRVRREHRNCNPEEEPDRCALLSTLFDGGDIHHRDFPDSLPTIFE